MSTDYDVAIVGCGPVGATVAALLGQAGMRVVAIERETEIYHLPRAVVFDDEIVRMYQKLGIAEGIADQSSPMRGFRYENHAGEVLLSWVPKTLTTRQGWAHSHMFHQPDVEGLIRQRMAELPTVELLSGAEVESITQDDDAVTVSIRTLETDSAQQLTASYAIGCDGGNSMVRPAIGAEFETLGPSEDWVVIDGVTVGDPWPDGPMVGYCWPEQPHMFLRMGHPRLRWEFMLMPGTDREIANTPEGAYELIERFGGPDRIEIARSAVYRFLSLLADSWRDRRIFLAGDAAHMQPPLRAQGLCSGIRDAVNLSWKLAAVWRGDASDALLDTYEAERRPHSEGWVRIAMGMAQVITTTDPEVAAARDKAMLANPIEVQDDSPSLGPGLQDEQGAPANRLSAQGLLEDGTRLDDITKERFLVAMTPEVAASMSEADRDVLADDNWFHVLEPDSVISQQVLAANDADGAVVVRPDRYVLGVASDAAGLGELLAKWTRFLLSSAPA